MSDGPKPVSDIKVDTDNLYREETYTDLRVATIRKLVPIKSDGSEDSSRDVVFTGETQLMSAAGMLPIQCNLEGTTLDDAIASFPEAVNKAVERVIEEAREMQRREASRIVVPGAGGGGGGMPPGGMPPGGAIGGDGKIHLG